MKKTNDNKTDVCLNNLEQRLKLDQLVASRREKIKPITARVSFCYVTIIFNFVKQTEAYNKLITSILNVHCGLPYLNYKWL